MCFGALKDWEHCELDAKTAVHYDDKYAKAYYWLIKASVFYFIYFICIKILLYKNIIII